MDCTRLYFDVNVFMRWKVNMVKTQMTEGVACVVFYLCLEREGKKITILMGLVLP